MRQFSKIEPAYFKYLANNATLNAREFAAALQVSMSTFRRLLAEGAIPPHTGTADVWGHKLFPAAQWRVSVVRKWFRSIEEKS